MRLTNIQHQKIKKIINNILGSQVNIILFGSRTDDSKKGGDVDILVELSETVDNPALLAARLSVKISNIMYGRKVDIIISAPNLDLLPVHKQAHLTGIIL